MKTCYANLIGRFGNQLFIYAHCRAWCEQNGYELITSPWIGEKVFEIKHSRRLAPERCDEVKGGYFQDQQSIIYTRAQVREWYRLRRPYAEYVVGPDEQLLAHRRVGDYAGYGFVVVSKNSYEKAAKKFGYDPEKIQWITEEQPTCWPGFNDDIAFLPDFIRLMRAKVLFRGNSTFSWWAATLGNAKVYAPVVDGLPGGKEQDCEFVEGNHPKMANLDFLTDLYIQDK